MKPRERAARLADLIADEIDRGTSHVYPEDWQAVERVIERFFAGEIE